MPRQVPFSMPRKRPKQYDGAKKFGAGYFDPRHEADMLATLPQAVRGELTALPPPPDRPRTWLQVAENIAKVLQ